MKVSHIKKCDLYRLSSSENCVRNSSLGRTTSVVLKKNKAANSHVLFNGVQALMKIV